MAEKISARLKASEGRAFGLTIGLALVVLGALLFWRGRKIGAQVAAVLGIVNLVGSLLAPEVLYPVRRVWMRLALAISKVTVPIFMGLIYFLAISVIGIFQLIFGYNAIKRAPFLKSFWEPHRLSSQKKQSLEHQY